MKRVLIITYYWPPGGGSGVQRWFKCAKYLASGRKILAFGPIDGDLALALKETQSGNIVDFQ